jgi:diamine N-acetyltransferase
MVSRQPGANAPELGPPVLNVVGERVALGPLQRDLLPAYQRWANDLSAAERLALLPQPVTLERQTAWYEQAATATDRLAFTIYETTTWQAIGTCGLNEVDHHQGVAYLAILIGVAEARGQGYGTEAVRLLLDVAFTALGLHNVMLGVWEYNYAARRAMRGRDSRSVGGGGRGACWAAAAGMRSSWTAWRPSSSVRCSGASSCPMSCGHETENGFTEH